MALKRDVTYPGRYDPATPAQPQGAFKNRTAPEALDGSYLEEGWLNDWSGFFSRLIAKAGIVLNGNVDTAEVSQYMDAAEAIFKAGRRNRLVNGDFRVSQRGVNIVPLGSEYCNDQWEFVAQVDGGILDPSLVRRITFDAGQTDVPDNPGGYQEWNGSISGGVGGSELLSMVNRAEGSKWSSGKTVVLSGWIQGSIAGDVSLYMGQHFGSGGDPSVNLIATDFTLDTTWQRIEIKVDCPSVFGKTYGANNSHVFASVISQMGATTSANINLADGGGDTTPVSYGGIIRMSDWQLELGDVATEFDRIAGEELLMLCYRYFQRHALSLERPLIAQGQGSGAMYTGARNFFTTMRVNPTSFMTPITVWTGVSLNHAAAAWTSNSVSAPPLGRNNWYLNMGSAVAPINGAPYSVKSTANSALANFSAEI